MWARYTGWIRLAVMRCCTASGTGPLDTAGVETVLHAFTRGDDGGYPIAGVIRDSAGNLYGTTEDGGKHNRGVIFEIEP